MKNLAKMFERAVFYNIETDLWLNMDVETALHLNVNDVVWFNENATPENMPYLLEINQSDLDKWVDGWYVIVAKHYSSIIDLEVVDLHDRDGKTKKIFEDMMDTQKFAH